MREYLLTPPAERRLQAIFSDIAPGGGSGHEPYPLPADVEFVFILRGLPRKCCGWFPPPYRTTPAAEREIGLIRGHGLQRMKPLS